MKAFVIARDRASYLHRCVRALLTSPGVDDIHIVDHGSTYPPMADLLARVAGEHTEQRAELGMPVRVHVQWRANAHPRDLWTNGTLTDVVKPDERFIVTDCDVIPPSGVDWVGHLGRLLDACPDAVKAGLGLRVDDLPAHFEHAGRVFEWEKQCNEYTRPVLWAFDADRRPVSYVDSSVDTTLAVYRRLGRYSLGPAVRSVGPVTLARHLPWYEDSANPTDEQRYYAEHAEHGHWRHPKGFIDVHGLPEREGGLPEGEQR